MNMTGRHKVIGYALEAVARPGARESRTRKPPDGMVIRNGRRDNLAESAE